jgi:thiamine biosynthesis protein ThiS
MRININGEEKTFGEPMTVAQLLALRGLSKSPCAVEINRVLVPKRQHEQQTLQEGDAIEIVTLVGGG